VKEDTIVGEYAGTYKAKCVNGFAQVSIFDNDYRLENGNDCSNSDVRAHTPSECNSGYWNGDAIWQKWTLTCPNLSKDIMASAACPPPPPIP